ncbi:MAG: hypothetical protein GWP91_04410 [Rhodobacterales bacterium]|nr:hypothetical protein [Rhodobacterales bacterium]
MTRFAPLLALLLALPAFAQGVPNSVEMDLDAFLKLYETAKNRPDDPEKTPWQAAIASARYVGEVMVQDEEPTSAVFRAKLRIDVLKDEGWINLPLLSSTAALRSAKINGVEAPVSVVNSWYNLVTDKKGAFDIDLEFAVSVNSSNGSSGFAFPLVRAGGTEVSLAVPAEDALDFTVANARLKTDEVVGGQRVVNAVLPSTGSLSVTWQREIPEAEEEEPRIYSEVHTLAGVGEGVLRAHVVVQDTILFNGVDELRVAVPADMTVLDVQGNGLRDWTRDDKGVLTAMLNFEAEGAYTLSLDLERVLVDGDSGAEVPIVQPLGVERSKGFVGVQALGNLELTAGSISGAVAVDVRTLPASVIGITSQPVLLGFKYLSDDAKIPLVVSEHDKVDVLVTLLDSAEATTMFTADGRRLTSVHYQVRNNRRQFLRLALPEGAELWSASVAGKPVQPAAGADGRLLIPLIRSSASGGSLAGFDVEVVYVESGEAPDAGGNGQFKAQMPTADAPTTWVGWTVYAPWEAKVKTKSMDGSLRETEWLSHPVEAASVMEVQEDTISFNQSANQQMAAGAMGRGAEPVKVSLPLDGQPLHFEKLLALDEALWVSFDYKGLK